jgi:hypothetical protein
LDLKMTVLLALGIPVSVLAGFGVVLVLGLALNRLLPQLPSTVFWVIGAVLAGLPVWLLVSDAARRGGWRTILAGLGGTALVAAASYGAGVLLQRFAPGFTGMAGIAWMILAAVLGVYVVVGLVMGAVAMRLVPAEEPAETAEEPSAES